MPKSKVKELPRMRVVDGDYMPKGAMLLTIMCSQGHRFKHRSNKRFAKCPVCKERGDLLVIRARDAADVAGTRIWQYREMG